MVRASKSLRAVVTLLMVAAASLLAAACADSTEPGPPPPAAVARVEVSPNTISLVEGETRTITAQAFSAAGNSARTAARAPRTRTSRW